MSKAITKATTETAVAARQDSRESVLSRLAGLYGVKEAMLLETLKKTVFKEAKTNEQLVSLCIVADQYRLNPFLKEIYAFPDKGGGIVPVVGIDGWMQIINSHPQFDGMEFQQSDEACTCTIYRKDRKQPVSVTEHLDECYRNTIPWNSHPRRMLRHKAVIQCSRYAFGFAGIYDPDEAARIIDVHEVEAGAVQEKPATLKELAAAKTENPQPVVLDDPQPAAETEPIEVVTATKVFQGDPAESIEAGAKKLAERAAARKRATAKLAAQKEAALTPAKAPAKPVKRSPEEVDQIIAEMRRLGEQEREQS